MVDTNDNIIVPLDYTSLDYVAPDHYFTTSGSATGSYNYTKSGNGQKIAISGLYIGDTTLSYSLTEYYDGNPCGEWEFTVTITGKSPASRQ